jgi:hypothetical protein
MILLAASVMAVLIKSVTEMPRKLAAVSTTRFSSFVTRASSLSVRFAAAASAGIVLTTFER